MWSNFENYVYQFCQDGSDHRSQVVTVTPSDAAAWVGQFNYRHQRPLRRRQVTNLAQCMTIGTFDKYTQLTFAVLDGVPMLVNGQHRLSAVAESGQPVVFQVELRKVHSLEEISNLYARFDIGGVRTTLDAIVGMHLELGLEKKESNSLSVAVKMLMLDLKARTRGLDPMLERNLKDSALAKTLMREWQIEARTYFAAIKPASGADRELFMRGAVIATALVTYRYRPDVAASFWRIAAGEDGLHKGDPRKSLTSWLRANPASGQSVNEQHKACIACWNAFIADRQLSKVLTKPGSSSQLLGCEEFHALHDGRA